MKIASRAQPRATPYLPPYLPPPYAAITPRLAGLARCEAAREFPAIARSRREWASSRRLWDAVGALSSRTYWGREFGRFFWCVCTLRTLFLFSLFFFCLCFFFMIFFVLGFIRIVSYISVYFFFFCVDFSFLFSFSFIFFSFFLRMLRKEEKGREERRIRFKWLWIVVWLCVINGAVDMNRWMW